MAYYDAYFYGDDKDRFTNEVKIKMKHCIKTELKKHTNIVLRVKDGYNREFNITLDIKGGCWAADHARFNEDGTCLNNNDPNNDIAAVVHSIPNGPVKRERLFIDEWNQKTGLQEELNRTAGF